MVRGGFMGNRGGLLKAASDIHCKYIADQVVIAGNEVVVGGEVFSAQITAKKKIVVTGSRGRITGGKIMAGDEIRSTVLGSDAGTRTELQVAYDAELMNRYSKVLAEINLLNENAERVKEEI